MLSSLPAVAVPSVFAVLSSVKVRPLDVVPVGRSSMELRAAKNEFEAFQVVIQGGSDALKGVQAVKPRFVRDGSFDTLPDLEVRIYREGQVNFTHASSIEGSPGSWPDPLIPDVEDGPALSNASGVWTEVSSAGERRNAFPADVVPHQNLVLWVEVHVPASTHAGHYRGAVTVTGTSAGAPFTQMVPVGLQVRDFALPSSSSLPTLFQLSVDNVCNAHGAGDASGYCRSAPEMRAWNRMYARFMLDHRITLQLNDVADPSHLAASAAAYAADYAPLIHGLDRASRLQSAQLTTVEYPWWQGGSASQSVQQARMGAWVANAKASGWFDKALDYTGDEPSSSAQWDAILNRGAWAHGVDPNFRTLVTTAVNSYNTFAGAGSGTVNVMVAVLDNLDGPAGTAYAGNQRDPSVGDSYAGFLAQSPKNALWGYQSCDQHGCSSAGGASIKNWPNFMVDATGVQNRAEPWMHYIYGATGGMLYFDTALALSRAWNTDGLWAFNGNGDGTFLYPGTPAATGANTRGIGGSTHIPVASLRLKLLREGLEDFEYLKLCDAVSSSQAHAIARSLFPMTGKAHDGRETGSMTGAGNYPASTPALLAENLEAAREKLAACILSATPSSAADGRSPGELGSQANGVAISLRVRAAGCSAGTEGSLGVALLSLFGLLVLRRGPHLPSRRRER